MRLPAPPIPGVARRSRAFVSFLVRDMRHLAPVDVNLLRAVDLFRLLGVGGGAVSIIN